MALTGEAELTAGFEAFFGVCALRGGASRATTASPWRVLMRMCNTGLLVLSMLRCLSLAVTLGPDRACAAPLGLRLLSSVTQRGGGGLAGGRKSRAGFVDESNYSASGKGRRRHAIDP